jgi:allantoicase
MASPDAAIALTGLVDLAARAVGGRALLASDEFFAPKERLLEPGRGVFLPDEYTDRGKWMDGWESRRKRVPGHDWCIVKLGVPGVVRAVDVDTNHFLGNHPPFAALDGCLVEGDPSPESLRDEVPWQELVPEVPLKPGSQNIFAVHAPRLCSHVRLHILPDGGVARLRIWGEPRRRADDEDEVVDLACAQNGGRAVGCSDMFFSPMSNLVLPGRAEHMGGGWETRRRRGHGEDWIVVELAAPGMIDRLELDTAFFKGNYPDRVRVEGLVWPDPPLSLLLQSDAWETVLPETKLGPDAVHRFEVGRGPFTHLRLVVLPCGGVSRMRAWGRPALLDPSADALLHAINAMKQEDAIAAFMRCCASQRWAQAMEARRPFQSRVELFGTAEHLWWRLVERDWREAFAGHPEIGGDVEALRKKFGTTASWSEGEQAGVAGASDETLARLATMNARYREKHGYIFIVQATGKTAAEMLRILEQRLDHAPDNEIRIAAGEQAKITRLRLAKLEEP